MGRAGSPLVPSASKASDLRPGEAVPDAARAPAGEDVAVRAAGLAGAADGAPSMRRLGAAGVASTAMATGSDDRGAESMKGMSSS